MLFKPQDGPPAIGLFALNMQPTVRPEPLARVAALVEESGYESVWVGEHPVLPDPPGPHSPWDPRMELVDPVVVLSFLAAITRRVRLGSGILLLPTRNPVILAKEYASLDVLSGGRAILGIGVGYIKPETEAVGVPYEGRGERAREHLEAMRSLWHDDKPAYHGRHVDFEHVDAHPRPVQRDLHTVAGGHTPPALRRAITHAHGWYGFGLQPASVRMLMRSIEIEADLHERPAGLGPLEITVTPPQGSVTPQLVDEYRAAGVNRLVLYPEPELSVEGVEAYVRRHAPLAQAAAV